MRYGYHSGTGRVGSDATPTNRKFHYVSNGRMKAVPADRCGGRLYLGVELEVDGFRTDAYAVECTEYVDSVLGEYAICMYDGSLYNGFEIVFDPMTLKAFAMIRPLVEQVMAELQARGGHSHDSQHCGLHVHTSRVAWGNDDHARSLAFGKAMELTERYQAELSAIARRDVTASQWCRPNGYNHSTTDSSRAVCRKANNVTVMQGFGCHDGRRYHVWNFQNRSTVECRAFKGTLKAETFYATLAFVDGLVRYCTLKTTPEVHNVTFAELIDWINDTDLSSYWTTRRSYVRIYTPHIAA